MSKRNTVTFGVEDPGQAGAYFRGELPAQALKPLGWVASTARFALTPHTDEMLRDYGPRIRGWNGPGTKIQKPASITTLRIMDDVVVDTSGQVDKNYHMENMAGDIRRAVDDGQIVLYDIDDDIWHIPEWSPAAKAMHKLAPNVRATDLAVVNANMAECSGVIVSSAALVPIVKEQHPTMPVYLMRPGVDPSIYAPAAYGCDKPTDTGRPLRVGWMGSISHHLPHLRTMQIALTVLTEFDAEFMRLGYIKGDRSEELLAELPCRVGQMPWGPVQDLPQKFAQLDLAIIPRVPTSFNESQSVTSGLQYAAAGIPFLVSPSDEYWRLESLGAGRVCCRISEWEQGLSDLLEDSAYRRVEAERAREVVDAEFGVEATGLEYHLLFERLLSD
jgi:hypothetical protein